MTNTQITIIITSFKSEKKIYSCLKSIDSRYKIIVIENSQDQIFKDKLEEDFSNLECILAGENLGYAKGNNLGLSKVNTKYALILNPDAILDNKAIDNFLITAKKIPDFSIIGPIIPGSKINGEKKSQITEVENVKGFAMFFNLEQFKNIGFFDKNIFIYLEEIDLCKRLRNQNKKIFLDPSIIVTHLGGSSHDEEYNFQMELSRNWHWMWSSFYYNKKHNSFLFAFLSIIPKLLSSVIKIIFYSLIMNKKKKLIYFQRFSGIINSILGKPSWYRPSIN